MLSDKSHHLVRLLKVETCKGFEKHSSKNVFFNIGPIMNIREMFLQNSIKFIHISSFIILGIDNMWIK